MKSTIYDIARLAGVSTATVSKVINNTGRISDQTRERINRIMEDLNYRPNVLASAMKGKSTYQIAFLIPDIDNPIYAQYLKHIEAYGQELGYNIVLCSTDNDFAKETRHITLLRQRRVDGFIIASKFKNDELLKQLVEEGFPIALFAHERPGISIDSVTVDDYMGGYLASKHLHSLGHRKIGVVGEDSISSDERIRGYKFALSEANIPIDNKLIVVGGATLQEAEQSAAVLLDSEERPSAIFGCNDILAIGVMQAAKARGIRIPEQLSVIGFDDTPLCSIVSPRLSSISLPVRELGKHVTDIIISKIEHSDTVKQRIRLLPELAVRDSTAPVNM
ncbi:MAG: LacI family DNA-binding transcriptional regulator [Bacillota bacterium]